MCRWVERRSEEVRGDKERERERERIRERARAEILSFALVLANVKR